MYLNINKNQKFLTRVQRLEGYIKKKKDNVWLIDPFIYKYNGFPQKKKAKRPKALLKLRSTIKIN